MAQLRLSLTLGALLLLARPLCARADNVPAGYTEAVELGVAEFEQKNFLEARTHLTRAHGLYPSARTLRGLGMVEFELRNYAESARYLQQALTFETRPLQGDKRRDAERLLDLAKGYLGFITLELAPNVVVVVDGARTELGANEPLVLSLGDHQLEFEAPNRIAQKRVVSIKGGEQQTLRIALAPILATRETQQPDRAPGEKRPVYKSPWLWTAIGVVVAGAAAGVAIALTRDPQAHTADVVNGTGKPPLVGPMR